jgi:hypothetical protein
LIKSIDEAFEILDELQKDELLTGRSSKIVIDPHQLIDHNFAAQKAFIEDDSLRKSIFCTRRAGKSNTFGRAQIKECFAYPGSSQIYFGLTKDSAKLTMWDNIIKAINRDLDLGGEPNETDLIFRFGDSQYILAGADSRPAEIEKKLGGKFRSAVIDEAGSFRQDLRKIAYEMMEPALADLEGWLGLGGTPTEITSGLFFDVSTGIEPGWSRHEWDTLDNPYMRVQWQKKIDWLIKNNPRIVETPAFQRMYQKIWVIDKDSKCYKYQIGRNDIDFCPEEDPLTHVLGIDLGFNDDSAFTVAAFSEFDRCVYFRESYSKSGMIISDVAERIQYYIDKYSPMACVIDNASKQSVEELKQRFNLPLIAAEKQGKAEFIEIMNSEFIQGNIKLVMPDCEDLATEYGALIWDQKAKPKRIEHPSCKNHKADASLYAWRYCLSYLSTEKPRPKTEEEKIDEWFDGHADRIAKAEALEFWEK